MFNKSQNYDRPIKSMLSHGAEHPIQMAARYFKNMYVDHQDQKQQQSNLSAKSPFLAFRIVLVVFHRRDDVSYISPQCM
jgi:hypothetical protein